MPANIDGLIIGGGFPEIFAAQLESNGTLRAGIYRAAAEGMSIYAECGGYMYLMKRLIDLQGRSYEMCGVIDGTATMTARLQRVGYVAASFGTRTFRAHEFHYSTADVDEKLFACTRIRDGKTFEAGVRVRNVVASYLHTHFVGCPALAADFLNTCLSRR